MSDKEEEIADAVVLDFKHTFGPKGATVSDPGGLLVKAGLAHPLKGNIVPEVEEVAEAPVKSEAPSGPTSKK